MSLAAVESGRSLEELEEVIGRGLETFVEVGDALADVRDGRLYLQFHDTFEAYCTERWGLSRKRAYDLIGAAETVKALSPMGDTPLPSNERQARALAPLKDEPEKAAAAMRSSAEATGGRPTAKSIAEAVKEQVAVDLQRGLDQLAERRAQRQQDREELQALADELNPEGIEIDYAEEARLAEVRGRFSRLCNDLAAMGVPDLVIADLRGGLGDDDRFRERAQTAHAWLGAFLERWEATT